MRFVVAACLLAVVPSATRAADARVLAAVVDRHLAARWAAEKVRPAAPADDAAFTRRVYLDLIGRVPTAAEVRAVLDDPAADKRDGLVARLLAAPGYARHRATIWRREWVPQADQPGSTLGEEAETWLVARLRDNAPYDRVVRDLLTAPRARTSPAQPPATFLTANEFKPENLAAATTRAFLGINLDCAQCHDHPFARWTRDQFWQTAAFFARPENGRLELSVPNTPRAVGPVLLAGAAPAWPAAVTPDTGRGLLAGWVTAPDNPYFARNAVNRVWAQLFGTGLVEPLDDLSGEDPPSHPELLDELAKAFTESDFDLNHLTAALVLSRGYQLSSVVPAGGSAEPRLFARAAVRGLSGGQLYDSLRTAAGLPPERTDLDPLNARRDRTAFAARFRVERAADARRSILQSLALMNGPATAALTDPATAPTLRAVAGAPFLDTAGKLEALFLAALGRQPTADELARLGAYVDRGGADGDAAKALADVFWALLNGSEFGTNH
ncbi:DUF1553 domain-containing protein [bacterium]|nr:DUF1553 domain-containing protein [bacterium]